MRSTDKQRPKILRALQERICRYFSNPACLPSLNSANQSSRQQRSERREACLLALSAIIEFLDLSSLRCGVPTSSGFMSLTLEYLCQFTGMGQRRMERAVADLKRANIVTISQPRQMQEDGTWRGLAAVKAVSQHLFTAFGLAQWLKHERERATKRLAKKANKVGGTLTQWARTHLVISGQGGRSANRVTSRSEGKWIDPQTWSKARTELAIALQLQHPDWPAVDVNTEADRILSERYGVA
jgi:DNA-binding transcriptional ArsR family regulator